MKALTFINNSQLVNDILSDDLFTISSLTHTSYSSHLPFSTLLSD